MTTYLVKKKSFNTYKFFISGIFLLNISWPQFPAENEVAETGGGRGQRCVKGPRWTMGQYGGVFSVLIPLYARSPLSFTTTLGDGSFYDSVL